MVGFGLALSEGEQAYQIADGDGLGMNLVDRRIKIRYGTAYGIRVQCEAEHWTRVTIALPTAEETVPC